MVNNTDTTRKQINQNHINLDEQYIFVHTSYIFVTDTVFDILKVQTMIDTGSVSYLGEKTPMHKH